MLTMTVPVRFKERSPAGDATILFVDPSKMRDCFALLAMTVFTLTDIDHARRRMDIGSWRGSVHSTKLKARIYPAAFDAPHLCAFAAKRANFFLRCFAVFIRIDIVEVFLQTRRNAARLVAIERAIVFFFRLREPPRSI